MNSRLFFSLLLFMTFTVSAFAQVDKIVGKWVTIDDKTGKEKSLVQIYKTSNGTYEGKVEKLIHADKTICSECEGANKNKPITGMIVIKEMKEKDGKLVGGTILDPGNGKVYNCTISIDGKTGKLKVRGSLDKTGILGRSQLWNRTK